MPVCLAIETPHVNVLVRILARAVVIVVIVVIVVVVVVAVVAALVIGVVIVVVVVGGVCNASTLVGGGGGAVVFTAVGLCSNGVRMSPCSDAEQCAMHIPLSC